MQQTPIKNATYGPLRIVRVERTATTPREYGERFYVLVDATGQRVTRTFHYLRNARAHAAWLERDRANVVRALS
jgi:hypothetical protein